MAIKVKNMKAKEDRVWAIVELMGHLTVAGRLYELDQGLYQINIPEGDGFRTEIFGPQAIYRIRIVSEEIARMYARPAAEVVAWDAPVVPRDKHERELSQAHEEIARLREEVYRLREKIAS